jgi:hypothetical protein
MEHYVYVFGGKGPEARRTPQGGRLSAAPRLMFHSYVATSTFADIDRKPIDALPNVIKMSTFDNMLLKLDETITNVLGDWDVYSTSIAALILVFFSYHVFTRRDPDTHPMLLERQAHASAVRNPGESSVYRSQSVPHGMEMNTGLNVRDPGISKWARGRDGDLRDIWRRAINGPTDENGILKGERGRILTILGSEHVVEHNLGMLCIRA